MQCQNCKTTLGCSCQQRIASDGRPTCTSCLQKYEQQLKNAQAAKLAALVQTVTPPNQ